MAAKFEFLEVVTASVDRVEITEVDGMEGTILGMAENDDGEWGYAVHFDAMGITYYLMEDEMLHTGKYRKQEEFYDGSAARVRVGPHHG